MKGLYCRDCGVDIPRRLGKGKQRERCDGCRKSRHREQARVSYQKTHPDWENGKARQAELQRAYLARRKAAKDNLTEVTAADLSAARGDLLAHQVNLMMDGSGKTVPMPAKQKSLEQASVDEARRVGQLEGDTTLAAERDKAERLREAVRVSEALPVSRNRKSSEGALGPARVLPGTKPIWKSLLCHDPLSVRNRYGYGAWSSNPGESGQPQALAAIAAASGDAMQAFAQARGAYRWNVLDAELLVSYLTDQLKPWDKRRHEAVIRRIEYGDIRDAKARPIIKRMKPLGTPPDLSDAIVDLAIREREDS